MGGALVDGIYYCPHDIGQCTCRKPQSGMFLQAQCDFPEIDFVHSATVGDSLMGVEAGWRLGCKTMLIVDETCQVQIVHMAASKGIRVDGVAQSLFDASVRYPLPRFDQATLPGAIYHPAPHSGI